MNQACYVGLAVERWYALKNPMKYNEMNTRKLAKKALAIGIPAVIIISLAFFIPQIVFTNWFVNSWENTLVSSAIDYTYETMLFNTQAAVDGAFVSLVIILICCQMIFSALIFYYWRLHVKRVLNNANTPNAKTAALSELSNSKEKFLLLFGTVGLNFVCMIPFLVNAIAEAWAGILSAIYPNAYNEIPYYSGLSAFEYESQYLSSFLAAFNGTLGIFIHIMCTKTYRAAFKEVIWQPLKNKLKCCKNSAQVVPITLNHSSLQTLRRNNR